MNIVYLYFDVCVKYITAKKVQFNNIGVAIFDEQLGDRAAERWLCHFKKQSTTKKLTSASWVLMGVFMVTMLKWV